MQKIQHYVLFPNHDKRISSSDQFRVVFSSCHQLAPGEDR